MRKAGIGSTDLQREEAKEGQKRNNFEGPLESGWRKTPAFQMLTELVKSCKADKTLSESREREEKIGKEDRVWADWGIKRKIQEMLRLRIGKEERRPGRGLFRLEEWGGRGTARGEATGQEEDTSHHT